MAEMLRAVSFPGTLSRAENNFEQAEKLTFKVWMKTLQLLMMSCLD